MTQIVMMDMLMANTIACDLLTSHGFQSNFLKAEIRRTMSKKAQQLVMVPNSKELVEALSKASTHCTIFVVTGGYHFTSNDMSKAAELPAKKGLQSGRRRRLRG